MADDRPTLHELLAEHRPYHSEIQMRSFITARSGPTVYGMWQQALRELDTRACALRSAYLEREVAAIDAREMEWQVARPQERILAGADGRALVAYEEREYEYERIKVRLRVKLLAIEEMDRSIADRCREFSEFYRQVVALRRLLGDMDDARREELDREAWHWRLRRMIAQDYACDGGLRRGTLDLICSLPDGERSELLRVAMQDPQEAIDGLGAVPFPFELGPYMPPEVPPSEVPALLEEAEG